MDSSDALFCPQTHGRNTQWLQREFYPSICRQSWPQHSNTLGNKVLKLSFSRISLILCKLMHPKVKKFQLNLPTTA